MDVRLATAALIAACAPEGRITPIDPPPAPIPTPHTDVIVQPLVEQADILWVIDDSSSMSDNQAQLALHYPRFMEWFEDRALDYHIGVVTTDTTGGRGGVLRSVDGQRWIDVDTDDPVEQFRQLAAVGTSGADTEAGLGAAYLALAVRSNDDNDGFRRGAASLHTIVISDEDDATPADLIDPVDFEAWYGDQTSQPDRRTFSAIVATTGAFRGHTYLDLTAGIGGSTADVHLGDWIEILDELGQQMTLPKVDFFLSADPLDRAVEVTLTHDGLVVPQLEGLDWIYDPVPNAVRFLRGYPAPGSEVRIAYWIAASPGAADP